MGNTSKRYTSEFKSALTCIKISMGTIKSERVHAKTFESREQAVLEIFEHIDCFYNRLRLHSALGYLSPDEYEEKNWPRPPAA